MANRISLQDRRSSKLNRFAFYLPNSEFWAIRKTFSHLPPEHTKPFQVHQYLVLRRSGMSPLVAWQTSKTLSVNQFDAMIPLRYQDNSPTREFNHKIPNVRMTEIMNSLDVNPASVESKSFDKSIYQMTLNEFSKSPLGDIAYQIGEHYSKLIALKQLWSHKATVELHMRRIAAIREMREQIKIREDIKHQRKVAEDSAKLGPKGFKILHENKMTLDEFLDSF